MHWFYDAVRHYLLAWGYFAILIALVGEDAGLPLPGESTLIFASFLAHKTGQLHLYWIIPVGIGAAVLGDNAGFLFGHWLGKTLLRWIQKIFRMDDTDIEAAKDLIRRRGGRTVFLARYIFGLRTVAGPLAGMLGMEWKRFLLFNFLGAASWVTLVSIAGYLFANEFESFLKYFETVGWIIAAVMFAFGYFVWRRQKKKFREEHQGTPSRAA